MNLLSRLNAYVFTYCDKLARALGCSLLALFGFSALRLLGAHFFWSMAAAIAVPVGIGAAKEMWDAKHPPHVTSWGDFAADVVGAAIVWSALFLGRFA